jgi:hypothetical protein
MYSVSPNKKDMRKKKLENFLKIIENTYKDTTVEPSPRSIGGINSYENLIDLERSHKVNTVLNEINAQR